VSNENEFEAPEGLPEESMEDISPAQKHWQKHRTKYIAGGVVAGTAVVSFVAGKHFQRPIIIDFKPVLNNVVNNNVENNLGYCTKIVEEVGADKMWPKAKILAEELAKEHGVSFETARRELSRNLNGHTTSAFGRDFRVIGLGTTG
jgi:hypothetical protein